MAATILGNHIQQSILLHCIKNFNLPHSLLFSGPEGIGKKLFALTVAKTLLCVHNNACGTWPSCVQIDSGTHPDVIIIEPNEKGTIPIGDENQAGSIRWLIARVSLATVHASRVVIINNAHSMNIQSQNALLKTIEEPPSNTFIILISSERNQLLPTIRSRVAEYVFHPLHDSDIAAILTQHGISQHKFDAIIPVSGGSASYALTLADDSVYMLLTQAYNAIAEFVTKPVVFSHELSPIIQAIGAVKTIDLLINMFRLHIAGTATNVAWYNSALDKSQAAEIIKILLELRKGLSHNINIRMALKGMLYSLCFTK